MKRGMVCLLYGVLGSLASGLPMTEVAYELTELGAGRWQYTYEVSNIGLETANEPAAIEEFTIWFEAGLYQNLVVTTAEPQLSDWDQIVWQPELLLNDAGAFDALAADLSGIWPGQTVFGFSVAFDWLGGTDLPGVQYYEVVNPETFETIDSGLTTPEPATILLFVLGGTAMAQGRRK